MLLRLRAAFAPHALWLAVLLLAGMALLGGQAQPTLEERTERTLSRVDGAGQVDVVIHMRTYFAAGVSGRQETLPCGALVVAQGAQDPYVRAELTQAVCALLGLPSSAVSVITGGGEM